MNTSHIVAVLVLACWTVSSEPLEAAIINGDFSSGDLSGWQTAAFNDDNQAIAPPIGVDILPEGNVASIATVAYAGTGVFLPITQLSQPFVASVAPLVFDIGFSTILDPNEPASHPFHDSFAVLLINGSQTYTILSVDSTGLALDPFGDSPGIVVSTAAAHPLLTHHVEFLPDPAALGSANVTLNFSLLNQADGFSSVARIGDVAVVPEPGCAASVLVLFGLWCFRRRRCG